MSGWVKHDDRRANQRLDATMLGPVVARLLGGSEVRLIDFSRHGVLVESEVRLQIGQKASLKITTTDGTITARGSVVRSRVSGVVGAALMYQTALTLEEDLSRLADVVQSREAPRLVAGADDQRHSGRARIDDLDDISPNNHDGRAMPVMLSGGSERAYSSTAGEAVAGASPDPVFEFLATVPLNLAELRRRAAVNNW
jgi:hypothetical protein